MTKLFLFGISGKMGKAIVEAAQGTEFEVTGGFDVVPHPALPTFTRVEDVGADFDVIVDFSRAEVLPAVKALALKTGKPVVLASTGYSDEQLSEIDALAQKVAVLRSGNMSVGVNLLLALVERAARTLADSFDIEIVEKHHNRKVDAPSGTALMLADAAMQAKKDGELVFGRHGVSPRQKKEITIHSVRGGTIVGEHDVIFAGNDEIVTLSHVALSRKIFAEGALRAAAFIKDKKRGLFSMKNAIED